MPLPSLKEIRIGIIGLGYAGLPLSVKYDEIADLSESKLNSMLAEGGIIYDIKGMLPPGPNTIACH